mmetsp:Transcript_36195/g.102321  ORF Transcript_36195/g.102321 Transcript_36195/m.102321 type:complete len:333 (+) Transcript_36195:646-1644(+)
MLVTHRRPGEAAAGAVLGGEIGPSTVHNVIGIGVRQHLPSPGGTSPKEVDCGGVLVQAHHVLEARGRPHRAVGLLRGVGLSHKVIGPHHIVRVSARGGTAGGTAVRIGAVGAIAAHQVHLILVDHGSSGGPGRGGGAVCVQLVEALVGVQHSSLLAEGDLGGGVVLCHSDVVPEGHALQRHTGVVPAATDEDLVHGGAGGLAHVQDVVHVQVHSMPIAHHLQDVPAGGARRVQPPPGVERCVGLLRGGGEHPQAVALGQHLLGVLDVHAVIVVGADPVAGGWGIAVIEGGPQDVLIAVTTGQLLGKSPSHVCHGIHPQRTAALPGACHVVCH